MSPAMRRETEFLAVADGQVWGARKSFATGAQSRIRSSATHHTEGVNQQAVNTVTHDAIPSPPFPALDDKSPARECGERTGQILSRRHFKGDRWPSDHGGGVRWCFQFYARLRTYIRCLPPGDARPMAFNTSGSHWNNGSLFTVLQESGRIYDVIVCVQYRCW